jgi:hypothetical protein
MIARALHGYKPSPQSYAADGIFDASKALSAGARHALEGARVFAEGAFRVPPKDQGDIGSCVLQALCGGMERIMPGDLVQLSELDGYRKSRRLDGSFPKDDGTSMETAIAIARSVGISRIDLFPYDGRPANEGGTLNDGPSLSAREDAWDHRIDAAHRIQIRSASQVEADVYASILAGRPVTIGGPVGKQYLAYFGEMQTSDPIAVVGFEEQHALIGGHERLLVGAWRRGSELWFLECNSWGTGGGLEEFPGHCWIKTKGLMQCDELFSLYAAPKEG